MEGPRELVGLALEHFQDPEIGQIVVAARGETFAVKEPDVDFGCGRAVCSISPAEPQPWPTLAAADTGQGSRRRFGRSEMAAW